MFLTTFDKTLQNIDSKFAFLDNVLIIAKGLLGEHEKEMHELLNRLKEEIIAINLQKREFAKQQIIWL